MVKVYCDMCKKQLKKDFSDAVNIDFHSYGISGFRHDEINLCVSCGEKVVSFVEGTATATDEPKETL